MLVGNILKSQTGTLAQTPLPVLLHAIAAKERTCALSLKHEVTEKTLVFEDGSPPYVDDDTEVRIEGGRLLVYYFDDEGAVVYDGVEEEPGRFRLMARSRRRTGMVRFDDSGSVLRGYFEEDGERFRFEIHLGKT